MSVCRHGEWNLRLIVGGVDWRLCSRCGDWVPELKSRVLASGPVLELKALQDLQDSVGEWADQTFGRNPDERVNGVLRHLKKEVDEVLEDPLDHMEWADCMMLLLDGARLVGLTPDDLLRLMREKLELNRQRDWEMTEDGIMEHVRGGVA